MSNSGLFWVINPQKRKRYEFFKEWDFSRWFRPGGGGARTPAFTQNQSQDNQLFMEFQYPSHKIK
jgi:hypothetical protein